MGTTKRRDGDLQRPGPVQSVPLTTSRDAGQRGCVGTADVLFRIIDGLAGKSIYGHKCAEEDVESILLPTARSRLRV